jgi:signal peptidase I
MISPARRALVFSAALVLAASAAVWRLRRDWAVVTVEGASMEPTFFHGDRIAVRRTRPSAVSTGDVVVVELPDRYRRWLRPPGRIGNSREWMIKRVRATSGDPVPEGIPVPDAVVPAGQLVVLGDNASASYDSRAVGYFPIERVLGVVSRRAIGPSQRIGSSSRHLLVQQNEHLFEHDDDRSTHHADGDGDTRRHLVSRTVWEHRADEDSAS